MKKISVLIPCYNEIDNVEAISKAVINEIEKIKKYDYEVIFIDNCSKDGTREKLKEICAENSKIKAILNAKNFGQNSSPYYGICQTSGDCTISMACDFQDPPKLIGQLISKWEEGYTVVSAIKTSSKENKLVRFLRNIYYKMLQKFSDVEMIEHFTGFGLYDKKFVDVMRSLDDPVPFLRGVVAEFGFNRAEVEFVQPKRRAGKTNNNFFTLYDIAMLSFTSYTTIGLRLASFVGYGVAFVSFIMAIIYLVMKLLNWNSFSTGAAPMLIGMFFIGSIQLIFLGFMGEYIINMNKRIIHRPLVIEEERINF